MTSLWYFKGTIMKNLELTHYGVKGMKWGVRRTPEQLGHKIARKTKNKNVEFWGISKSTNAAYLTGPSGSGKSTLLSYAKSQGIDVISLDYYLENVSKEDFEWGSNKSFNRFLERKSISISELKSATNRNDPVVKNFRNTIDEYSENQYGKKKVLIEGAQIGSGFLGDIDSYSKKPLIVTSTPKAVAFSRRLKRDSINLGEIIFYMNASKNYNKKLNAFIKDSDLRMSEELVQKLLEK